MSSGVRRRIKSFIESKRELKRRSFSERICDDLSEVILQFLSLEDKVRLQCVSNQFQRTIFQKQNRIKVTKYLLTNGKALQSVLKKCQNITEIVFQRNIRYFCLPNIWYSITDFNKTIALIVKHCNHLSRIDLTFGGLLPKTFQMFVQKFGSKLSAIETTDYIMKSEWIQPFDKLKELHINNACCLLSQLISIKTLKKLEIKCIDDYNCALIRFISKQKSLEFLSITKYWPNIEENNLILREISYMKNLKHLSLIDSFGLNAKLLSKVLKPISVNCLHLKSIECEIITDYNSDPQEVFRPFKQLKALKRVKFVLKISDGILMNQFSVKAFNGFNNLSHLSLKYFNSFSTEINDNILEDIDKYLPKLQYFELKGGIDVRLRLVDILNKLSSLETIKLQSIKKLNLNQIKKKLTQKCRKIKSIDLNVLKWHSLQ